MIEARQTLNAVVDAIGAKRAADAMNLSLHHVYKLLADPVTLDAPVRNDVERLTNLYEVAAAHPKARPALILSRLYWKETFARILDRESAEPLSSVDVVLKAQELCAEVSDVLRECKPGYCPDKIAKEASELIAVLEQLVAMAEVSDDTRITVPLRRAR